jgi:hypothetical protein
MASSSLRDCFSPCPLDFVSPGVICSHVSFLKWYSVTFFVTTCPHPRHTQPNAMQRSIIVILQAALSKMAMRRGILDLMIFC